MDMIIRLTEVEFAYTAKKGYTSYTKKKRDVLAEEGGALSRRDLALSVLDVANTDKKKDMQLKLTFQLHALLPDKTIKSEDITFCFDGETEALIGIDVTLHRFMNQKIKAYDDNEAAIRERLARYADSHSPSGLMALFAAEIEAIDVTEVRLRYVRNRVEEIVSLSSLHLN